MWLQVGQSPRVLGTKGWREAWGLNVNLWPPVYPIGLNTFSLILLQHLRAWHSGRPHLKQNKLVRLINMTFFCCCWFISRGKHCPYLLKVSQNAGKSVYTVYMVLFGNSFRRSLSSEAFGLSQGSLMWVLWIFQSVFFATLKLSPRKLGGGNKLQRTLRIWWFKEK